MAFEDVQEAIDTYWNPENVKDSVEGNVYEIKKDNWDNDRVVLDLGDDEDGNLMTTTLPAHAHLKKFIPNLEIGDYIRVELTKLIPPRKENGYPKRIYKVLKDPDRKVEWPEEESSDDDYFE